MTFPGPPPPFGHITRDREFAFKPGFINLNCGSFGATPRKVTAYVDRLTEEIEQSPDYFHRLNYQERLIEARARVASHVGAATDEIVLVMNTTTGVNTVLRNILWQSGDTIVTFDKLAQYLSDINPRPTRKIVPLLFPTTTKDIIANFQAFANANPTPPGKKTVVVIDSIVSNPGALLPWKELVTICKSKGFLSVIDAAHSIGQEPNINLRVAQPDFWVSACYKWFSTKRSVAALLLKAHEASKFRQWMGGELAIDRYCHDLALRGGVVLKNKFGTEVLDPNGEFTLHMVNVKLPYYGPSSSVTSRWFQEKLIENNAFSVPFYHNGFWWTRVSAQIWNELSDFERIGDIWLKIINELKTHPPRGPHVPQPSDPVFEDPEHPI
ncbi:hypothetical protein DXG01_006117 [Tephrocybe rancida]|nr:hypothetical protein DXG01_006117 [Tephrocybe rancida]